MAMQNKQEVPDEVGMREIASHLNDAATHAEEAESSIRMVLRGFKSVDDLPILMDLVQYRQDLEVACMRIRTIVEGMRNADG
jgi:hypothetical protein